MELFRNLAGNIFFKIILGLVAVSFVFFGVSGFILGNPNAWVVKVGGDSFSQSTFNKALRADRAIVLSSANSPEAMKYLESDKFKSDVLGRLVNKVMIEKLRDDFGVSASKKIIFQAIAKDPGFKNESGKFDLEKFRNFLSRNGLNEERYVNEVSNEVASAMILRSLNMAIPIHYKSVLLRERFKGEKRVVDILSITPKDVKISRKIGKDELNDFFAQNRHKYAVPEMRQASYLQFSKKGFVKEPKVSASEVFEAYERNKESMMEPEKRDFYQVVFDKKDEAISFINTLGKATASNKSKIKSQFAKLAKKLKKKDLKAISMKGVTKREMFEGLVDSTFNLSLNQISEPLEGPLGFHVFLLNKIKKSQPTPFSEVKAEIKESLKKGRREKALQAKISQIDEIVLASGSLKKVAKEFNLKTHAPVVIDAQGLSKKGSKVKESKKFENFVGNIFDLKEGQVSKLFYTKDSKGFYLVKLEKIIPAREKELKEVKSRVKKDLLKDRSIKAARDLAKLVVIELKSKNPNKTAQTANKHHISVKRDLIFPRYLYLESQGRKMPYQSKIIKEIFGLKVGQVSEVFTEDNEEFKVIVLKDAKRKKASSERIKVAQEEAIEEVSNEIMTEYNSYLLKRYPVKVNEKFFNN